MADVRIGGQLGTVKVFAVSTCTAPGRPDPELNPDFSAIILQLRLNADAQTYQIRRADLDLSKMPPELKEVTAVRVTTLFREISPSIVVIHDVNGISSRRHSWLPWSIVATTEDQRMLRFQWLREDPAHPPVQPSP